jgi:lysophospholipase L1-like esterase
MSNFALSFLLLFFTFTSCQHTDIDPVPLPEEPDTKEKIDMLCLGDSYTKGQSVVWGSNFPNQLADSLSNLSFDVVTDAPRVIAQTGWRTDQLKNAITAATDIIDSTFSIVTLCIGVNNQYQNTNFDLYAPEFEGLLKTAIVRAGGKKERVFVVSIPDWAFTSYGQQFPGGANVSSKIDEYNAVNRKIAADYQVNYIDVTPVSRQGIAQPNLVASDGLHPSAVQYTEWVKLMLPKVKAVLE